MLFVQVSILVGLKETYWVLGIKPVVYKTRTVLSLAHLHITLSCSTGQNKLTTSALNVSHTNDHSRFSF